MPTALWSQAARSARTYGVARVCRWVRLDYYTLKERVAALARQESSGPAQAPGFIELTLPLAAPPFECVVELEHPRGARMRIQLKGAGTPDLAALSRSFWSLEP